MRSSSRRSDADADVIRRRLRTLLDERTGSGGWLPDEESFPEPGRLGEGDDTGAAPLGAPDEAGEESLPGGLGRHRAPGPAARWDPGRLGARSLWAVGLLAALLLVGWTWLDRPQVERVDGEPTVSSPASSSPVGEAAETSATIVVAVVGQVTSPGLVTLPTGSRVADAVAAAGGLLPEADAASVNLAAVVADGEQVAVGLPGPAPGGAATPGAAAAPAAGGRVDLNTAGVAELDALPGIGPVLAQRIVDHRTSQGRFRSVDELDDVPGIGPAIAAELAELVTV